MPKLTIRLIYPPVVQRMEYPDGMTLGPRPYLLGHMFQRVLQGRLIIPF